MSEINAAPCSVCGTVNRADARFCQQCGASIRSSATRPLGPDSWPSYDPGKGILRLKVGLRSVSGPARVLNEDSLLAINLSGVFESKIQLAAGFFAIADGIGGHESGEIASREAIRAMGQEFLVRIARTVRMARKTTGEQVADLLTKSITRVNEHLYRERLQRQNDMGATITAALFLDGRVTIANVGDSRTYLWHDNELDQVTRDHSLVASLVEAEVEPPEAVYTHPQKGYIYRSLGQKQEIVVDVFPQVSLQVGDRLILCCDGIWEIVRDEGIEEVILAEPHPQRACDRMIELATQANAEDNLSVIVVAVETV